MSAPDRAPRIIEVDRTVHRPDLGRCQYTMQGRTRKRHGHHITPWTRQCPNRAVIRYRGRCYCQQHRPAGSTRTERTAQ